MKRVAILLTAFSLLAAVSFAHTFPEGKAGPPTVEKVFIQKLVIDQEVTIQTPAEVYLQSASQVTGLNQACGSVWDHSYFERPQRGYRLKAKTSTRIRFYTNAGTITCGPPLQLKRLCPSEKDTRRMYEKNNRPPALE